MNKALRISHFNRDKKMIIITNQPISYNGSLKKINHHNGIIVFVILNTTQPTQPYEVY